MNKKSTVSLSIDKESKRGMNWVNSKFFPNKIKNKYNWENDNLMKYIRN